ncbi:hypothetical protein HELRODRAFT_79596, partial [Helobdella robusta]|uniref:non-specific serine/threonine protein kinase n=1 Tax=Helobdella robusta TaxID=6412 RepID=T1G3Q5_HELRO
QLEEALLFWVRGEVEVSRHQFSQLCNLVCYTSLLAKCLILFGDLLVETQSENPAVIMDSYYNKAINLMSTSSSSSSSHIVDVEVDAVYSLASYADAQYRLKIDYMNSSLHEEKLNLMHQAKFEINRMNELSQTNSRYYKMQERHLQIDERELKQMKEDCDKFFIYSIENYLKCLLKSSKYDSCIYRFVSLWFDASPSCNFIHILENYLPKVPTYKFVPLMYQLAARMNLDNNKFQSLLLQLVERSSLDHPHHVLPIVMSLALAKYDDVYFKPAKAGANHIKKNSDERTMAAQNVISRIKQYKNMSKIVNDLENLNKAYIELAYWNVDRFKEDSKPIKLNDNLSLKKIRSLKCIAVPTVHFPVNPGAKYKNFVYVEGFEGTFTLAGGINLPKIITCKGSDGISRKQLIKGRDDLRQDAVMQQVFQSVNSFLKNDAESSKRNLLIRTYKVVPLSQRSGLLEWCSNTTTFGHYLSADGHGAHMRYRPQDLKPMECRRMMTKAQSETNDQVKLNTYLKICERFQPVFRHFFFENFASCDELYHRKLAYTRSVATNSIVGYILGLGDRHVQNILIDLKTAELIHIDFGVAFEQGWNLPTPETIPFRLTRDVVDGMGVVGVEGTFRRCCEKTMVALRANKQVLLTILQVLLYDPLYDWSMSPLKAERHQPSTNCTDIPSSISTENFNLESSVFTDKPDVRNKMAERVLLRLNQKLCGSVDGIQLGVQGHVSRLIQQAIDPTNLSKLFPGWQPYL